jgi:hypothetical protein
MVTTGIWDGRHAVVNAVDDDALVTARSIAAARQQRLQQFATTCKSDE